jgi:hypothetical protein
LPLQKLLPLLVVFSDLTQVGRLSVAADALARTYYEAQCKSA